MADLIDKLQQKLKIYKKQIEETVIKKYLTIEKITKISFHSKQMKNKIIQM